MGIAMLADRYDMRRRRPDPTRVRVEATDARQAGRSGRGSAIAERSIAAAV